MAAERHKRTAAIIDLDPQASATSWKDLRTDQQPVVVSAQPTRLAQVLATANEHGARFAFIALPYF